MQWLSKLYSEGKNSDPLETKATFETSPELDLYPMEERHPESQTPTLDEAFATLHLQKFNMFCHKRWQPASVSHCCSLLLR